MKKRYAILETKNLCPILTDNSLSANDAMRMFRCGFVKDCQHQCKDIYGDTKEQLINKIATALARITKDGDIVIYEDFGTGLIESISTVKNVAKGIVEFLGVKE